MSLILQMPGILEWIKLHFIEVIATLTGFIYIIFTIREDIRLWLFGIISSALFIWVYSKSKIYAYSILYVYYVVMGFYGWYKWSASEKQADNASEKNDVRKCTLKELIIYILITIGFSLPVYYILVKFSDSDVPAIDALLTSSGMVATWMLTQKLIEQWLFWVVIDVLSFGLMIFKGLYASALLFLVYTILAVIGYIEWKRALTTK